MIVGCPVYERSWVLPRWLRAVEKYLTPERYLFVYTPSEDRTGDVLHAWSKDHDTRIITYTEGAHGTDRDWSKKERITTLADMRNVMLDEVGMGSDEVFVSLDSDVVLTAGGFMHHMSEWDVVGPTVALATDRTIINGFTHRRPDGYLVRAKPGWHGRVDVLCAAKMMWIDVVRNVRYGYHPRGEDFFFAEQAKAQGFSMGLCTEVADHYMHRGRAPIKADWISEFRPIHG